MSFVVMRSLSGIRVPRGIPVIRADWHNRLLNPGHDSFQLFLTVGRVTGKNSIRQFVTQRANQSIYVRLILVLVVFILTVVFDFYTSLVFAIAAMFAGYMVIQKFCMITFSEKPPKHGNSSLLLTTSYLTSIRHLLKYSIMVLLSRPRIEKNA